MGGFLNLPGVRQFFHEELPSLPLNNGNTLAAPHSCIHCAGITVRLQPQEAFDCWLDYGVLAVITAAREGCLLYRAFLDELSNHARREVQGIIKHDDISFVLQCDGDGRAHLRMCGLPDGDREHPFEGKFGIFYICARADDPAAQDLVSRPTELDVTSDTSMTFARQCIKHCMQQHEECRRPLGQVGTGVRLDASDIPTRLLKIVLAKSGDEDEVCAVQLVMKKPAHDQESTMTTDDVAEHGYAALSYCWGTAQPLVLNASTAERLHTQVPLTALPLTIQDAVRMASAVGLSYIWIDALCIMQDSDDDKAGEIARMAQYYGCSALTISAASAARCSDGFLGQRTDSAEDYTLGPVVLQAQTATGTMGRVLLLGEKLERNGFEQPPEPTTRRGWTLQESLLSRRLLIFSSRQLHFTCMVGNASCGGSQPAQLTKRGFAAYLSPVPGIATLSGLYELPISRMWFVTVTQYTRRRVTDAGDKLPALSAVASVLVAMARDQRGETLTYLAGLFLDTTTPESPDTLAFLADLLWHTNRMDEAAVLPDNRPSWSWASVDGSVVPHGRIRDVEVAEAAKLCAHHIELDNQLNPYGKVRSGRLVLEARTCRLPLGAAEPHVFVTPDAPASEKQPGTLSIYPDTPLRRKAVLSSPLACDVRLVGLIFQKDAIHGLVVTSAEGEEMQRIGTFEYYPDEEKSPFQGPRRIVLV